MKKRFLPFSLLLVIMILGQSVTIADNGGHYVPRTQGTQTAEQFMSELRVNQNTGLIDPALMLNSMQSETKDGPFAPDSALYWLSMGPDNMGGQTTAIIYDNKVNGVVYIGSKGGGVYKTYNYGITWHQVGAVDMMVSCMAQDAEGNIYVGTGDGLNAVTYNGLSQQSYDNSFVGYGVYKIDANDVVTQLEATLPAANNDAEGWAFVNDIAVADNILVAATNGGLMYSTDKGATWATALEDACDQVKVTADNNLVVSSLGKLYIGTVDNLVCHSEASIQYDDDDNIIALPTAAGLLDIATAPSDANTIYAAVIAADGNHTGLYVSYNKGQTWEVALPAVTSGYGHNVYGGYGLYNHGLVVDPNSNGIVYLLGYDLWKLQRPEGQGYFITEQVTNGASSSYYLSTYLHVGLHAMAFNPNNANECYIGTDGGIYKATISGGVFNFNYCNRNYITTRMFSVGMSGSNTRILAAGLDHGTVLIEGDANTNTMGYAEWINPTGYNQGAYDEIAQAGPCAISAVNPKTIFVTYKNGDTPTVSRSETAGEDWVSTNFLENLSISSSSFRLPILLFEDFDDEFNPDTVWFKNTTEVDMTSGTTVQCMSNNNYPFDYTLSSDLAVGDSIDLHDPISSRLYVAFTNSVYVTRTPLRFASAPAWYCIANKNNSGFVGEPLSFGISADGDHLWVGTKEGSLYRLSNLNTVVDAASGSLSDTTGAFQVTTIAAELPIEGQCVTSVAVDPRDANKVVVTLGNYGNENYVFYSSNALSETPTFTSKQGNLPLMPIYSSLIEMSTGHVILGTERGIYKTTSIDNANWVADTKMLGNVPVMELKQQLLYHPDQYETVISGEETIVNVYPGVCNTGIIYAATYGRGVFRCENYKLIYGDGIPEVQSEVAEMTVNIYPNPVRTQANVKFDVIGNQNVNYQVYDMMGRLVMDRNLGRMAKGSYEITVNTSELSTGSYILRLSEGEHNSSVKFLVY